MTFPVVACPEARPHLDRYRHLYGQAVEAVRDGQTALAKSITQDCARAFLKALNAQIEHDARARAGATP